MSKKPQQASGRQNAVSRRKRTRAGAVEVIEGRPRIFGGEPYGTDVPLYRSKPGGPKPRIVNGEPFGTDVPLSHPAPIKRRRSGPKSKSLKFSSGEGTLASPDPGAFGSRARPLRLLCVHGVGHQQADPNFRRSWISAISRAIGSVAPACVFTIDFLQYDSLIKEPLPSNPGYVEALNRRLLSSVIDSVGNESGGARGFGETPAAFKRTVAYIASWLTNEKLRAELRKGFIDALAKDYDAVFAHSLGSLICYDALVHNPGKLAGKTFVTFGSQIGHPAIRDVFAGRIQMQDVDRWFHLFNPEDQVLTARIRLVDPKFVQVDEPFDVPDDELNHSAAWYLEHPAAIDTVWRALAGARSSEELASKLTRTFGKALRRPDKRALLIGINDYSNPSNRLEGCVNDVFSMSALLQESGFDAAEIRIVLNERATTKGILDRLHWLLDGVRAKDQRFLYYSGHGAQIPGYDATGEPSHIDECLVPYDFDWSASHAIIDRQFSEFYSQLDYESWFISVFDCCHAGGLSRGGPLVRGLTPPDDIRHRALRWDPAEGMWIPRKLPTLNESLHESREGAKYLGLNGATRRLGRSAMLRTLDNQQFNKARAALKHKGPYLPVVYEACGQQQLAYEYRHGGTAYGAYTFCLIQVLRKCREEKRNPTFSDLHAQVREKMQRLKLGQTPEIVGNQKRLRFEVPWTRPTRK